MVAVDLPVRRSHHALNALGSVLVPLSSLLVAPLLTRALGPAGQGDFSTSQSIIVVAASILGLGTSDSLAVYGNYWLRRFRFGAWMAVLAVAFLLAAAAGYIFVQAGYLHPDSSMLLGLGAVMFAAALVQRGDALNRNMILAISVEKWITAMSRLCLTAGFFATGFLNPQTAVLTLVVPQALGYLYLLSVSFRVPREVGIPTTRVMRKVTLRPLRTLNWAVLGGLGGVLLVNLDPIVLRPLIGAEQLGYYAIGMLVAELFTVAAKPFRDAAMAGGHGLRKAGEFTGVIKWCALVMTVGVVVCAGSLWAVIPLVFGEEFRGAVLPALILAFGGWAKGLGFLVNGILVKTGHARMRAYATLTAVVFSVGGMVVLSPFGAVGAAIAGSIAYLVMLVPGVIFLRAKKSKLGGGLK
ncbi:lipopolysaccharide biosynthesis protein [Paenarthrobacter sp. NPDC090522]|uniref:lipopolysaccharide biosynthesis protein n=1 Tax=Paenarthrobacter sp. NPDC090522 TaxID=3364383 RepID=UPI003800FA9A